MKNEIKFETEVHYQVWDNTIGDCIVVGPDKDGLNLVHVTTRLGGPENSFGKVDLTFQPKFARLLAHALIDAADNAEAAEERENGNG